MSQRTLPAGFIAPCLPTKTDKLPSGGQWLHEIKHDGFRINARKSGAQVRLYSRPGNDAKAVVLDFVQPSVAGRQLIGFGWKAPRDEPGRKGTLQHVEQIKSGNDCCNWVPIATR